MTCTFDDLAGQGRNDDNRSDHGEILRETLEEAVMDARGSAHRREIAAMQLYQARLEQQLQSLRKDKERLALLSKELARRAEEAGLALTEQISDGCNAWLRWSTTRATTLQQCQQLTRQNSLAGAQK